MISKYVMQSGEILYGLTNCAMICLGDIFQVRDMLHFFPVILVSTLKAYILAMEANVVMTYFVRWRNRDQPSSTKCSISQKPLDLGWYAH